MKIAVWNCQGLNNSTAVRGLLNFQKSEGVDILFLSETCMTEKRMMRFKQKLQLENMVAVDSVGKGGGIAVLWRGGIDVMIRGKSKNYIDMVIKEDDGRRWRFTGIYGESRAELKHETWTVMRDLHDQYVQDQMPWLCAGDFNEILFHHEKEGGVPRG